MAWVLCQATEVDDKDDEGCSPLTSALEMEQSGPGGLPAAAVIHVIDLLLAAGASINLRLTSDDMALHKAAAQSSGPVLRHLLARGADPLAVSHDYSPRAPAARAKALKRDEAHRIPRERIPREAMDAAPSPFPTRQRRPTQH